MIKEYMFELIKEIREDREAIDTVLVKKVKLPSLPIRMKGKFLDGSPYIVRSGRANHNGDN